MAIRTIDSVAGGSHNSNSAFGRPYAWTSWIVLVIWILVAGTAFARLGAAGRTSPGSTAPVTVTPTGPSGATWSPSPLISQGPDTAWPSGISENVDQFSPQYHFLNVWEDSSSSTNIAVYAGGETENPNQGAWWMQEEDRQAYEITNDQYPTPTADGPVTITSADGHVLTLTA